MNGHHGIQSRVREFSRKRKTFSLLSLNYSQGVFWVFGVPFISLSAGVEFKRVTCRKNSRKVVRGVRYISCWLNVESSCWELNSTVNVRWKKLFGVVISDSADTVRIGISTFRTNSIFAKHESVLEWKRWRTWDIL